MNVLPVRERKIEWGSIFLLIFSLLGLLGFSGLAILALITGLVNQLNYGDLSGETTISLSTTWNYGLVSGLLLLLMVFAIFRISGVREPAFISRFRKILEKPLLWLILLWPLVIFIGPRAVVNSDLRWILLPPLHLLTVCIPVVWITHLGRRGLNTGSFQRSLATLSAGMVGSFLLALIAEIGVILIFLIAGAIIISSNPKASFEVNLLVQRITDSQMDSDTILTILDPYLKNPLILFIGLAFLSGLVPLIEEFFKPLGVWLLGKRLITPADGFAAGLLAGSGFALVESLGQVGSMTGMDWVVVEIGRGGTDLLHIFTTGMMGWALVSAWKNKKIWLAGLTFLGAVIIHGLWNGLVLGIGLLPFFNYSTSSQPFSLQWSVYAWVGLSILIIAMFITLLRMNHILQVKK